MVLTERPAPSMPVLLTGGRLGLPQRAPVVSILGSQPLPEVFKLGSLIIVPAVDVLEVGVKLNQDPVVRRRPVGDVDGLRQRRVASRHGREGDRPIRRLSRGHPDVYTRLEGRLEIRYRFEGRNLILGTVESE